MAFTTKIEFRDERIAQYLNTSITLQGITNIGSSGTIQYVEAPTINTPLKLPHAGYVTGLTAAISNRLTIVEDKYITGATNGLTLNGKLIELGGTFTKDVLFVGNNSYDFTVGVEPIDGSNDGRIKNIAFYAFNDVDISADRNINLETVAGNININPGGESKVILSKIASYDTSRSTFDFTDNDLVDKAYVDAVASGALSGMTLSLFTINKFQPTINGQIHQVPSGSTTPYYLFVKNSSNYTTPTINLPNNPLNGFVVRVKDISYNAGTYNILVNSGTKTINNGVATEYRINTNSGSVELFYYDSENSWFTMAVVN